MDHIFESACWIADRKHQIRTVPNAELRNYYWLFGHWCTHNLMDPYNLDYTKLRKNFAVVDKPLLYAVHPLMNPSDDEYLYVLHDLGIETIDLAYYTPWQGLSPKHSFATLEQFDWSQSKAQQVTLDSWYYYVWQHNLQSHMQWKTFQRWCVARINLASLNNPQ